MWVHVFLDMPHSFIRKFSTNGISTVHNRGDVAPQGQMEARSLVILPAGELGGHRIAHWVPSHCNRGTGICLHLYLLVHHVHKFCTAACGLPPRKYVL